MNTQAVINTTNLSPTTSGSPYSRASSLGGEYLPATARLKSSDKLKMRRTLMDSYNETVRSAPKVKKKKCFFERQATTVGVHM